MSSPYNVTLISEPSVLFVGILKMLQVFGPFLQKKKKCLVQYLFCPLPVIDPFFSPLSTHCCSQRCSQIPPLAGRCLHQKHAQCVSLGQPPWSTLSDQPLPEGTSTSIWGIHFFRLITGKKTWKQTNKIKKTLRDTAGWEFCQSLLGHWNLVPLCVSVADGTRAHGDSGEQRRAWMPSINDCSRSHVGPAWTECSVRPLDECVHSVVCERCSLYSLSSFKSVPDFHRKPSENTPQTDVHV